MWSATPIRPAKSSTRAAQYPGVGASACNRNPIGRIRALSRIVRLKSYVRIFSLLSQLRRPCLSDLSQTRRLLRPKISNSEQGETTK